MALIRTQDRFYAGYKSIQHIKRNKRLYGAGKAAAMNTIRSSALEQNIAQCQCNSHFLVFNCARGGNILQVHPGTSAGFLYKLQKRIHVTGFQCFSLFQYTAILLINMDCSENCPVRNLAAKFWQRGIERIRWDLPQHFLSEKSSDFSHFCGNGGIFIGQVCMICATVDNTQGITCFCQVKVNFVDDRFLGIFKVNIDQTANRGYHLIHQTAGLTKVHIFCVLTNLRDFHCRQLLIEEQLIQDGSEQDLKSCRGTETTAGKDGGVDYRIKALKLRTSLDKAVSDAANQCGRAVFSSSRTERSSSSTFMVGYPWD